LRGNARALLKMGEGKFFLVLGREKKKKGKNSNANILKRGET